MSRMETASSSTKLNSKYDQLRVYQSITEEFFKLKKIYQETKRFGDLFKPRVVQLRQDLREHCELLMFEESAEYGVKSEDLLWRCVYHNLMKNYQQHQSATRARELNLLLAHLQSGVGHYYSILLRFVNEYDLKVQRVLPEFWQSSYFGKEFDQVQSQVSFAKADEINRCVHKILIHIGDIYRYLDTLGQENGRLMASKWYNAAVLYDWSDGMPFNQLGTLALHENRPLEAAFYYMRCLTSEKTFDGAEGNLRAIFNNAKLQQKDAKGKNVESATMVRKCLSEFLTVVSDFWNCNEHLYQLESRIVNTLNSIKESLQLPIKLNISSKPLYLTSTIVFQMGVILLMLVERFKPAQLETSDQKHLLQRASIGFTLNFFYYVVSANTNSLRSVKVIEDQSRSENSTPESRENSFAKNVNLTSKRALARVRRRRPLIRFGDNSDASQFQLEDEECDLNELEETAMSAIDALEMSSDLSQTGSLCDNYEEEDESTNSMATSEDDASQPCSQQNLSGSKPTENVYPFTIRKLLVHLYYESNLPAVKVLCNWLMSNPLIIRQHVDVLGSLLNALVELLNLLLELEEKAIAFNSAYEKLRFKNNWTQKYPLSVDMALIGFQQLASFHKRHVDFSRHANHTLTDDEMGFLCIQSVLSFGHFLTDGLGRTKVIYDFLTRKFYIVNADQLANSNVKLTPPKEESLLDQRFPQSNYQLSLTGSSLDQTTQQLLFNSNKCPPDLSQAKTAFDFNNSNFLNKHFSMLGDFNRQMNEEIVPNMAGLAHLWLDSNDNQITTDPSAPLSKPKDFCSQALTSA